MMIMTTYVAIEAFDDFPSEVGDNSPSKVDDNIGNVVGRNALTDVIVQATSSIVTPTTDMSTFVDK